MESLVCTWLDTPWQAAIFGGFRCSCQPDLQVIIWEWIRISPGWLVTSCFVRILQRELGLPTGELWNWQSFQNGGDFFVCTMFQIVSMMFIRYTVYHLSSCHHFPQNQLVSKGGQALLYLQFLKKFVSSFHHCSCENCHCWGWGNCWDLQQWEKSRGCDKLGHLVALLWKSVARPWKLPTEVKMNLGVWVTFGGSLFHVSSRPSSHS